MQYTYSLTFARREYTNGIHTELVLISKTMKQESKGLSYTENQLGLAPFLPQLSRDVPFLLPLAHWLSRGTYAGFTDRGLGSSSLAKTKTAKVQPSRVGPTSFVVIVVVVVVVVVEPSASRASRTPPLPESPFGSLPRPERFCPGCTVNTQRKKEQQNNLAAKSNPGPPPMWMPKSSKRRTYH